MKSRHLNWLTALSLIPLLLEMPYVFRTMGNSPLESKNYVFLLLAIAQVAFAIFMGHKNNTLKLDGKLNTACLLITLFSAACLAVSWYKLVHLAVIISSIGLFWSVTCIVYSWPTACALLPACAMFLLGVPSTGFLLGNATGLNGLAAKALLAAVLLPLTPLLSSPKYCPPPAALLYAGTALAIAACYGMKMTTGRLAPPLMTHFKTLAADGFHGTDMAISEADKTFYGNSDISRFLFSDAEGHAIHVLEVANVADIHAIHPMAYCLRASGYTLESEQTFAITTLPNLRRSHLTLPNLQMNHLTDSRTSHGNSQIFINEIVSSRGGRRSLHWQWYTTPEHSTASFLLFRSIYSPAENWRMIHVSTDLASTPEKSRLRLQHFLQAFGIREN